MDKRVVVTMGMAVAETVKVVQESATAKEAAAMEVVMMVEAVDTAARSLELLVGKVIRQRIGYKKDEMELPGSLEVSMSFCSSIGGKSSPSLARRCSQTRLRHHRLWRTMAFSFFEAPLQMPFTDAGI